MSEEITARDEVLGRIRAALPAETLPRANSYASITREYRRIGELSCEECLHLFLDRLLDYETEVIQIEDEVDLSAAVARVLQQAGESRLLVAPEFPQTWLPAAGSVEVDHDLSADDIGRTDAVLTTCEAAVASTGTIILLHSGAQGRRAITLLPDHHICLVRRDQIFASLPEALAAISPANALPITTISGPSATSDIEMTRIRGVHGPRRLTAILYGPLAVPPGI